MPLDVDALVKASRFKNSPLSSPVIDSPDAAKIRMNDMLSSLNLTGQNCREMNATDEVSSCASELICIL